MPPVERKRIAGYSGLYLNKDGSEARVPDDALVDMSNMEMDRDGSMVLRKGSTNLIAANGLEDNIAIRPTGAFDLPKGIAVKNTVRPTNPGSGGVHDAEIEYQIVTGNAPDVYIAETGARRVLSYDKSQEFLGSYDLGFSLQYGSYNAVEGEFDENYVYFARAEDTTDPPDATEDFWEFVRVHKTFAVALQAPLDFADATDLQAVFQGPTHDVIYDWDGTTDYYIPNHMRVASYKTLGAAGTNGGVVIRRPGFAIPQVVFPDGADIVPQLVLTRDETDIWTGLTAQPAELEPRGVTLVSYKNITGAKIYTYIIIVLKDRIQIQPLKIHNEVDGDTVSGWETKVTEPAVGGIVGADLRGIVASEIQVKDNGSFDIYVADDGNNVIRKYTITTTSVTVPAFTGGTTLAAPSPDFTTPYALAYDVQNDVLYATDAVATTGRVLTWNGSSWTDLDFGNLQTTKTGPMHSLEEFEDHYFFGDRFRIFNVKKTASDTQDWEEIYRRPSAGTATRLGFSNHIANKLLITRDGIDNPLVWSREDKITTLSIIAKPAALTTEASADAAADYIAHFARAEKEADGTFKILETGPFSDEKLAVAATNRAKPQAPPSTLDPRVNYVITYQKLTGASAESEYTEHGRYPVGVADGAGFVGAFEAGDDRQITQDGLLPPQDPAPRAKHVGGYQNRVLLGNTVQHPNRWWWSAHGLTPLPWHFDLTYFYDDMPSEHMGFFATRNYFLVFCERGIYKYLGELPVFNTSSSIRADIGNLRREIVTERIGCPYPDTIRGSEDRVIFLGSDDVLYQYNGITLSPLHHIQGLADTFKKNRVFAAYGELKYGIGFTDFETFYPLSDRTNGYDRTHNVMFIDLVSNKIWKHDGLNIVSLMFDPIQKKWIGGWSFSKTDAVNPENEIPFEIIDIFNTTGAQDYDLVGNLRGDFKTKRFDEQVMVHGVKFDIETLGELEAGTLFSVQLYVDGSTFGSAIAVTSANLNLELRFQPAYARDFQVEVTGITKNIKFKGMWLVVQPLVLAETNA